MQDVRDATGRPGEVPEDASAYDMSYQPKWHEAISQSWAGRSARSVWIGNAGDAAAVHLYRMVNALDAAVGSLDELGRRGTGWDSDEDSGGIRHGEGGGHGCGPRGTRAGPDQAPWTGHGPR